MNEPSVVLSVIRRALLVIFLLGTVATIAELFLLEHTEGWQIAPLVLLALSLVTFAWHALGKSKNGTRAFQATMLLFGAGGILGTILHYNGNVEFELEMYPSLGGMELFLKALHGAFPALAPGMMIHLGLVGLAYAYLHPYITTTQTTDMKDKGV